MNAALLLIDIQKDYFDGGKNPLVGSIAASQAAARLLEHFRKIGLPVIHIHHVATKEESPFFLQGTEGAEPYPALKPTKFETVLIKHCPDSFMGTSLSDNLKHKKVDRLVICGMMSHMCVDTTVRSALGYGFTQDNVMIAKDACATMALKFDGEEIPASQVHGAAMSALSYAFAEVYTVDQIIQKVQP